MVEGGQAIIKHVIFISNSDRPCSLFLALGVSLPLSLTELEQMILMDVITSRLS